jgi:hypothetical protein
MAKSTGDNIAPYYFFFNMVMNLFVFAPALVANAMFFNAVVQGAGRQPQFPGGIFLNPEVLFQCATDDFSFFFV